MKTPSMKPRKVWRSFMNRDMHLAMMPRGGGNSVRDNRVTTPQQTA